MVKVQNCKSTWVYVFVLNKKSITVEDQDTYLDEDYQERKAVVVMDVAYILHEDNLLGKVEDCEVKGIQVALEFGVLVEEQDVHQAVTEVEHQVEEWGGHLIEQVDPQAEAWDECLAEEQAEYLVEAQVVAQVVVLVAASVVMQDEEPDLMKLELEDMKHQLEEGQEDQQEAIYSSQNNSICTSQQH